MTQSMTDTPEGATHSERQRALIDGLRELADFLEANPEIDATYGMYQPVGIYSYGDDEPAKDRLVRLARQAGGRWEKRQDGSTFELRRSFGPHTLALYTTRENVCERIVVGRETVTREVPDPEQLAKVPLVTVTEEVERVEWRCPDSLLGPGTEIAS